MSEIQPEVCLAHRSATCTDCDEFDDELWVHPRDLPPGHESCRLCRQLIEHRQAGIERLELAIAEFRDEIAAIENGDRHNDFHQQVMDGDA